ncbi:unnamed protein product [Arctogadus glacialis]
MLCRERTNCIVCHWTPVEKKPVYQNVSSHNVGPQKKKDKHKHVLQYQYERVVFIGLTGRGSCVTRTEAISEEMVMMIRMMMMHVCSQSELLNWTYLFDPRVREVFCLCF